MKFRKTFNISVLEKSNTKITLSAYASAYDLSGKGGAGEKEVEPPPLPPGFPVTVDDALRQCSVSCGHIPKDFTMHCHDKAVSRGGEDSHKVPIRDFGAYVRTQWKYEQNRTGEQASNGKSSLPAWRQLQHLQDAIDSHPANRESVHHRDDCTQSQKDDLRAKRKALAELKAA